MGRGPHPTSASPLTGITAGILGHARMDTEPIAATTQNWNHTAAFSRGGDGEYLTFRCVGELPSVSSFDYLVSPTPCPPPF